jgi:FAD/FMN-containing dehydrogenase
MQEISSWGNYFNTNSEVYPVYWQSENLHLNGNNSYLPIGMARSYGDCCLNHGGALISTRGLNRFLSFDEQSGILCCQSGVSLSEILDFAVPKNWFLPVSPGTKHVSVGGAIANDVHGKNHQTAGTFGENVIEFELERSNGERFLCSREKNPELFKATIAGLGLTGLILWAKIRLKKITSPFMKCRNIIFHSLEEFFDVSREFSDQHEYSVAWMDCASKSSQFGRGIFMCADHGADGSDNNYSKRYINLPVYLPKGIVTNYAVSGFNKLYFALMEKRKAEFTAHYDPYFYPLDVIGSWNRIYGKNGFFQFQGVVPYGDNNKLALGVFEILKKSEHCSYLTVVKEFSEREASGLMSFPRKGLTICFDIPNKGPDTLKFIKKLNDYACSAGGAIYPAKDASMSPDNFITSYRNISEFSGFIDKKFSSSFWRRVSDN